MMKHRHEEAMAQLWEGFLLPSHCTSVWHLRQTPCGLSVVTSPRIFLPEIHRKTGSAPASTAYCPQILRGQWGRTRFCMSVLARCLE